MKENLKVADKKLLLVLPDVNKNVYLSARNLQDSKVVSVSDLNTYKIMNCKCLVLTETTVAKFDNFFNE
jgi:large subunit ribosomal protein L4